MKKGFTLLEVLVATIIFVVCVVSILWAFNTGMFAYTDIENVDLALNIAQERLENIKDTTFADITSTAPFTHPAFPNFTRQTVVVVTEQDPDTSEDLLKRVDVTVTWTVKGEDVSVTLTTLVASY